MDPTAQPVIAHLIIQTAIASRGIESNFLIDVTIADDWLVGPTALVETNPDAVPNSLTSKDQGHATLARAKFVNSYNSNGLQELRHLIMILEALSYKMQI